MVKRTILEKISLMNILFITNTLPPEVDGVGDYTLNLAKEFAKHGHEVSIVCKKSNKVLIDCTEVGIYPIVDKWNKGAAIQVKQLMQQRSVEMVCLQYVPHGFEPHGLPLGLLLFMQELKKAGTPIFTFFHEVYWHYRGFNLKYLTESVLMAQISKRIIELSNYVATSITHYADLILNLSGKKAVTIPIASNIPVVNIEQTALRKLKSKIAPNNEFVVAFIGKRDLTIVSGALRKLIAEGYPIKILLIGNANNVIDIKERYCFRTGLLDIDELSKYVAISDCMIMPENATTGCSFKSGSLAAALSFGLPVITVKGIMTDAVLNEKENILFVNPASIDDYYEAIKSLLTDNGLNVKLSMNALSLGSGCTWQATYQKYLEIYNKHERYR